MALQRFIPIFSQSVTTKLRFFLPSLKSVTFRLTVISLQSLRLNLCLNALSDSVGYGGLGALHCFGYFSNYIDIKLFSPMQCTGMVQKSSPGLTCFNSSISLPLEAI